QKVQELDKNWIDSVFPECPGVAQGAICSNRGICQLFGDAAECVCNEYYFGDNCQFGKPLFVSCSLVNSLSRCSRKCVFWHWQMCVQSNFTIYQLCLCKWDIWTEL